MRTPRRYEKPRKTARKSRKIDARGAPGAVRASQNRSKIAPGSVRTRFGRPPDAQSASESALGREKRVRSVPLSEKSSSEARPSLPHPRPPFGNLVMDIYTLNFSSAGNWKGEKDWKGLGQSSVPGPVQPAGASPACQGHSCLPVPIQYNDSPSDLKPGRNQDEPG